MKKITIISLVCLSSLQPAMASESNTAIVEIGMTASKSPWFVDGERADSKNTTLPGFTAASAFSLPLTNKDVIAFDIQSEFLNGKNAMNPTEEFGPTTTGLISGRYEKHFDAGLVAPFVGFGKSNQKDGGGIGYMVGFQALTKSSATVNFFGTIGHANFVTDRETPQNVGNSSHDGAFIGQFGEVGALINVNNKFAYKLSLGYGKTDKSKQETTDGSIYEKSSYRTIGFKGIYQLDSLKDTAITFGVEQMRNKMLDGNIEDLTIKNVRASVGLVMSFGGKTSLQDRLRPLAPTLDPLRASVYGEVADTVSY